MQLRNGIVAVAFLLFSSCSDLLQIEVRNSTNIEISDIPTIPYSTIESCPISLDFIYKDGLIHDEPSCKGEENAIKKGFQMAFIKWTPLNAVPCLYSSLGYIPGVEMSGIPYSSVKHINTFVGLDISFHTFLTALFNPYSFLYTEDVSRAPYNGTFCAPYYGTVCSTTVMAALGSDIPYFTSFIPKESIFEKCEEQHISKIHLCDILWSGGHVVLVVDIGRDANGDIQNVCILETNTYKTNGTTVLKYNLKEFEERWNSEHFVRYRYKAIEKNLSYYPSDSVALPDEGIAVLYVNEILSTKKGDMAPYRVGEDVYVDVLTPSCGFVELYKDNEFFSQTASSPCLLFSNLPFGSYKARFISDSMKSEFIFFEVLDTSVSIEKGSSIKVIFSSENSRPVYICLCEGDERRPLSFTPITEEDISLGYKYVDYPKDAQRDTYCKVIFKGDYGRVANDVIPLS